MRNHSRFKQHCLYFLLSLLALSCNHPKYPTTGSLEKLNAELDQVIEPGAVIEILADGFVWSEGPVWLEAHEKLLFTDVPSNTIYEWSEKSGLKEYLTPSGFTGNETRSREPGANGLALDAEGFLVMCQHGDRRVAKMNSPLTAPSPNFTTLADRFNGNRFNSPNDLALHNGSWYFTDPPYGLAQQSEDPDKEISFQGVYRVDVSGDVHLLIDSLTRPNGIAFTPDGNMIVANSDPEKPFWYHYVLDEQGIVSGSLFYDASHLTSSRKGLPDGLKIDSRGYVYATGPGGVLIFNPDGKLLGTIRLENAAANCALSADEKTLFITNHQQLVRVQLKKR